MCDNYGEEDRRTYNYGTMSWREEAVVTII